MRTARTLLVILNPREIPACLLSLQQIDTPKVWVKNYSERQLEDVLPAILESEDWDRSIVVSDDVIASTDAFRAVDRTLDAQAVSTGWCNLDSVTDLVSLTRESPQEPYGTAETYSWRTFAEVLSPVASHWRTYHPSFAMTGMSREMWRQFPWRCFGGRDAYGWSADLDLAIRLAEARIPIWAPHRAFMYHVKRAWQGLDHTDPDRPDRHLFVDVRPPEIVWDV